MPDTRTKIAYSNHDLRNNIGSAISSLELLLDTRPELKDDFYLSLASAGLTQAIEHTKEIASLCALSNKDVEASGRGNLELFSVKDYWDKYSRTDYDHLRKLYDIEINDTYQTLPDEKFGAVDPESMARVRENIITNAISAGATRIDISYEMKEYAGCVTFSDNGRGLTQEEIDKIMLLQIGDGVIHGLGTKSIINCVNNNGFHISYSANKSGGSSVRIIFPYIDI